MTHHESNTPATARRVYRVEDVCRIFGISIPTVYRLIKKGDLPQPKKLGGSTYWPASQIDVLIDGEAA